MRIYLKLSKNKAVIPFNYQQLLTGCIHKWLGKENSVHGRSGQLSFSWLQNTTAFTAGVNLSWDSYFFISAINPALIKKIISSIIENPSMFNGVFVREMRVVNIPEFDRSMKFMLGSPILLKWREENKIRYVTIKDADFEHILNHSFSNQLTKAGISPAGCKVYIDVDSRWRSTKLVDYKGIKNKGSLAPLVIEGTQEQIAYAWCTGLGNSTGIGFGALK